MFETEITMKRLLLKKMKEKTSYLPTKYLGVSLFECVCVGGGGGGLLLFSVDIFSQSSLSHK